MSTVTIHSRAIDLTVTVLERWGYKQPYRVAVAEEAITAAAPEIALSETREWFEFFLHHPVESWSRADLVRLFGSRLNELRD